MAEFIEPISGKPTSTARANHTGAAADTPPSTEAAYSGSGSDDSRDKTAPFPKLYITAIHSVPHFLDGVLIVDAFDIFRAPKMVGAANDVGAIPGHGIPLSQGGVLPKSQRAKRESQP
jgi:hypothetical protein